MIRAVIDTNLLASGLVERSPETPPSRILRAWFSEAFELALSDTIREEVTRTLQKPYFKARVPPELQAWFFQQIATRAIPIDLVLPVSGVASHPEDDLILATALNARADYLITGDGALLNLGAFESTRIVTAGEFVAVLDAG